MIPAMATQRHGNTPKFEEQTRKEKYEPPTIREVWDESVGTVGLFLLEM
jgi:hypothetical protein